MKSAAVRGRCPQCKALRNGGRLKNHTDDRRAKFKIWLAAFAKELLRHGGKNEKSNNVHNDTGQ